MRKRQAAEKPPTDTPKLASEHSSVFPDVEPVFTLRFAGTVQKFSFLRRLMA
jgi:hypothetical protein